MAEFKKSIIYTLGYEGWDLITDDPSDKGGATRYGISLNFAQETDDLDTFDLNDDSQITKEDIKLLTSDKALDIYKEYFWDIARLDDLSSDKKAFIFFDAIVNHGLKNATGLAQKTLIDLGFKIKFDKIFGKNTFNALEQADEDEFVKIFLQKRKNFFQAIVNNNPSQNRFIKGWLNRIEKCRRDVENL